MIKVLKDIAADFNLRHFLWPRKSVESRGCEKHAFLNLAVQENSHGAAVYKRYFHVGAEFAFFSVNSQ